MLLTIPVPRLLLRAAACGLVIFLNITTSWGGTIDTFDTMGNPIILSQEVKKRPDQFLALMKEKLRSGNLGAIGSVSPILTSIQPTPADALAINSLYLSTKGDLDAAKKELQQARQSSSVSSFYVTLAESMILLKEEKYDEAIAMSEKAAVLDKTHPYPYNISGRALVLKGRLKEGAALFVKAIELEPTFTPGLANLGATAFMLGDLQGARQYFSKAISIDPSLPQVYQGLALIYEKTAQYQPAIANLLKVQELTPGSGPEILAQLGRLQLAAGLYEEAIKTGNDMRQHNLPGASVLLADADLHLGRTTEAFALLEKMDQSAADTQNLQGFGAMMKGEYQQAIEHFTSVLKKDPDRFGPYAARAVIKLYLNLPLDHGQDLDNRWDQESGRLLSFIASLDYAARGDHAKSVTSMQAAEGIVPGFSMAGLGEELLRESLTPETSRSIALGVLYFMKGFSAPAKASLKEATTATPASPLANYWLGHVYLKENDTANAIAAFHQATVGCPTFFPALYALGELHMRSKQAEEAKKYYSQALQVKVDAAILLKLGLISESQGNTIEAVKNYETLIQSFPDFYVGYNQLAWLYAKQGTNLDKALTLAEKADALQKGNKGILDTRGWILFQKKEYEQALPLIQSALELDPEDPTLLYHLGAIENALGDKGAAQQHLSQSLDLSATFEEAAEAKKLLFSLKKR